MNKIAVVYHSKYGSTQTYAQWIAEEMGADLYKEQDCKSEDLAAYNTIIFGGAIHAGGILGIKFLQKNFDVFHGKRILIFAVGLSIDDEKVQAECREINLVKKLAELPCFFCRGAYDPEKLSGMDKVIMTVVRKMIAGKKASQVTESETELLAAFQEGGDFMNRAYIEPIVKACGDNENS